MNQKIKAIIQYIREARRVYTFNIGPGPGVAETKEQREAREKAKYLLRPTEEIAAEQLPRIAREYELIGRRHEDEEDLRIKHPSTPGYNYQGGKKGPSVMASSSSANPKQWVEDWKNDVGYQPGDAYFMFGHHLNKGVHTTELGMLVHHPSSDNGSLFGTWGPIMLQDRTRPVIAGESPDGYSMHIARVNRDHPVIDALWHDKDGLREHIRNTLRDPVTRKQSEKYGIHVLGHETYTGGKTIYGNGLYTG